MTFYEREFIGIRRSNAKMEIVGTLKGSVEREDVHKYILSRIAKEKRVMVSGGWCCCSWASSPWAWPLWH